MTGFPKLSKGQKEIPIFVGWRDCGFEMEGTGILVRLMVVDGDAARRFRYPDYLGVPVYIFENTNGTLGVTPLPDREYQLRPSILGREVEGAA